MDLEIIQSHPNPQPSAHHRKIELQSPLDLAYLQQNLANSVIAKLDLHFPPIPPAPKPATVIPLGAPSEQLSSQPTQQTSKRKRDDHNETQESEQTEEDEDPLRSRVKSLISEFLQSTWQTAQTNLSINGLDASNLSIPHKATLSKPPPPSSAVDQSLNPQEPQKAPIEIEGLDFKYAPFDPRLSHKLASLHGDLERLTAEVSALRRTAPQTGARTYETALTKALTQDDEAHESQLKQVTSTTSTQGTVTDGNKQITGLDTSQFKVRKGWNEDVRSVYEHGVRELGALAGTTSTITGSDTASMGTRPVPTGTSMTETMGKVQRAYRVALEME